jgi:hypothetical protein
MRLLILTCLAALLAAPAAQAGEVPPLPLDGRSDCVRPAGTPGELLVSSDDETRLVTATRDGFSSQPLPLTTCGAAATNPSGAAVVAGATNGTTLRVAVRDPGGGWGAPTRLAVADERFAEIDAAAVNARGDAVVVWIERGWTDERNVTDYRVRSARRAAGGTFAVPVTLARMKVGDFPRVSVGLGADGAPVVLWTELRTEGRLRVNVSVGGGKATRLADVPVYAYPSLAVGADGRALVAFADGRGLAVAERAPGGGFGAPVRLSELDDDGGASTAVALGAGGEAVVAASRFSRGGVIAHTRSLLGAFRPAVTLAAPDRRAFDPELGTYGLSLPLPPGWWGYGGADLRATVAADGRALVTWSGPRRDADVRDWDPALATVPLDGSTPAVTVAGGGVHDPTTVVPLALADGTTALSWVEEPSFAKLRLRLLADGAGADPGPAPPEVQVSGPASRRLRAAGALVLPVTCGGPCEVRAQVAGRRSSRELLALPAAGKGRLRLRPLERAIAPARLGPVRVRLTYAAPDGRRTASETLTVRLVRGPLRRAPKLTGVRAERVGGYIHVRWTLDRPALEDTFLRVLGARARDAFDDPLAGDFAENSAGRRSFEWVIRPARGVRWVAVQAFTPFARGNSVRYVRVG